MAAIKTFELGEFEVGYFLAWTITSQCQYTGEIVMMTDANTPIATVPKNTMNPEFTVLSQDYFPQPLDSKQVNVTVVINEANQLKYNNPSGSAITDDKGRKVGYIYTICIEDSTDDDYNDIYINLVGWKKKG